MPKYGDDIIPICMECESSENTEITQKTCIKCQISFCVHYASEVDIRFCGNCLSDFKVIETIETKTTERILGNGEVISRKRQIARNIKLEGMDWLFQAQKISTMTDDDILNAIEYHGAIKSLLMNEREERRIVHFKAMSQIKLPNIPVAALSGTASSSKKRTKIEKKAPDANAVAQALGTILGASFDPTKLAEALANLKKK